MYRLSDIFIFRASVVHENRAAGKCYVKLTADGDAQLSARESDLNRSVRSALPLITATAAAAEAPLPQESVSPLPRSYTRMIMLLLPVIFTNSVFIPPGRLCSSSPPIFSSGTAAGSGTKMT